MNNIGSRVLIVSGAVLVLAVTAALAYVEADNAYPTETTADEASGQEEAVAEIRSSDRPGNVVRTSVYVVELNNGTSFTFTESRPGPGSLCNTDNPKPSCKTRTEEGYTDVEAALSDFEFATSREGSVRRYTPKKKLCVTEITQKSIQIHECRQN